MNLLISLPLGIVLIALIYLTLSRVYKGSLYMLAGILALVVVATTSDRGVGRRVPRRLITDACDGSHG